MPVTTNPPLGAGEPVETDALTLLNEVEAVTTPPVETEAVTTPPVETEVATGPPVEAETVVETAFCFED